MVDAVLSTTAAPIFFPPHVFSMKRMVDGKVDPTPSERCFCDGGLVSNNPSMQALMLAL